MNLKSQGLLFCFISWAALWAMPLLPRLSIEAQLLILSPVILVMGVPHGALDVIFARQYVGVRSVAGWSLFGFSYIAAATFVVGFWWITPGIFLAAFLLISIFHFSGDPEGETSVLFRTLYGGSVILCPLIIHAEQVTGIFALVVGFADAQMIVLTLNWAAWPWMVAIGLVSIAGMQRQPLSSFELVSVAALMTLAPPLTGFTLFFCGMHSARHVLRTHAYSKEKSYSALLMLAFIPMSITVAGVISAWWLFDGTQLDERLTQLIFVGLASLTVPHMVVVEKVRLTGWQVERRLTKM